MQLNVFSTDNHKSGFRLQYLEVLNWGTFDEHIHSIKPNGETSLLTGANGSGKTTFIDALLTLMVPEKRYRFYNQSSGSEKKGDRTEDSYVMGGYGMVNNEATGVAKTLYLRENKEDAYSILLANFANEADQYVTLFQVRYFVNGDMRKIFGVAHRAMHIADDFSPFDMGGTWKRRIDQLYNKGGRRQVEWFDAASKYAQRMVEALGMQSIQAVQLFNQTVGIKVLGNLDDFIRTNMLEPRNMEEQFQELKKHLTTLLDAQRNIEKAEEQIRLLGPIKEHHENFSSYLTSIMQLKQELNTATIWNSFTRNQLLTQALIDRRHEVASLQKKIEETKVNMADLLEQERVTKNLMEQNKAGQRLQQLEKDIQDLEKRKTEAEESLKEFAAWCETLHVKEEEVNDDATYQRILKEANRAALKLETEQRLNEEDEYSAKRVKERAESEKETLEKEIELLHQSRNNIPSHLVDLRKEICSSLRIDVSEILFAGELIQVKSEEIEWQPALEKLLHSFSLRLLVPEKHYKKVTSFVNNNNLRTRLIYYQIKESALTLYPEDDTVYHKLDFHPDHKLSPWVQQQIIQNFSYVCVNNERELQRNDMAITVEGLIKNRDRHEKDDRAHSNDASRYVMGWNNERKKDALISKRSKLNEAIISSNEILQTCKSRSARLQKQFYAAGRLKEHKGFDEINIGKIQKGIRKAQDQIGSLTDENQELDALKQQLLDIERQKEDNQELQAMLIRNEALEQRNIEEMEEEQQAMQHLLQHVTEGDKDELLNFQQQNGHLLGNVTLENVAAIYKSLRENKEQDLRLAEDARHKEEVMLNRSINRLKNPQAEILQRFPDWISDVHALSDDAVHATEYIEWLDKLTNDNLPGYKKDFESYINVTITYKIGGLNEEMEKWERDISNTIQKLNDSLAGINFNRLPDTYIQLVKRPVASGSEAREFKSRLLDALPQAANWQQSTFEEKAQHFRERVQPLIAALDESEAYRARVLDARNWFEFWADERFRETNESKKIYRQMGQLSGGEKAQLTYTILCSAIAYQFGITREGKNARSLRFIAVDESFSNQDEEKATYLMELCKQLHLQLLVVTPSDKIQIVQNFIAHVHLVQRVNGRQSILYNMTVKELQNKMADSEVPV
ncbi:ATP-binding protein [Chitinophaga pinensis]|uniref:AAA family ATPase n=1 Tax=Chitinophaga pinensis TaxID=79329 RepID=A0A5C6LUG7_9BACT|nr:SbcC/MukB-like Walker B domain-containing protein [Chitinophaga pinensis]TWW00592.1 AAA family ATPase [Chitinophaga pinensis]